MKIAINICDLDVMSPRNPGLNPIALLLKDFCNEASPVVNAEKTLDGGAIVVDGPAALNEKRLLGLVDYLQTGIGPRKLGRAVRCYRQGPRGGWKKISPGGK